MVRSPKALVPICAVVFLGTLAFASSAGAAGGTGLGWGYNFSGQVGNGTRNETGPCYCVATPASISGLANVTQIAAGYEQGLALLDDGTVMAWGYNYSGQLGDGTRTDRSTPAPVPGLSNVIAVSAAYESSYALLANGSVMSWGKNNNGQLGNGTSSGPELCEGTACSRVPIPVPGVSNAIAFDAGGDYILALLADGTVLAWGENVYGTLGDGIGSTGSCECIASAQPVPGLSGVVAVSAGDSEAAALLADGTMRVWGNNREGELGTGVASPKPPCYCLGPTSPTGLTGIREITAGGHHTMATLAAGSEVKSWGGNSEGQVGNGQFSSGGCECVPAPITIPGLQPASISAGSDHSVALLANGTGVSWGEGGYGQLGNGMTGDLNIPGPISGLSGASELVATVSNGYAIVGPSQALTVAFAGAGSGGVGGNRILCPPSCADRVPQGQVRTLRAVPDAGSGFAGFSGPCTGTGACQAKMSTDQTVTATFGPPKGTAITKATIKNRKKKATFTFSAPGAISGYECKLIKPKPTHRKKSTSKRHALKKGKKAKPKFSSCSTPKAYKNLKPGKYTFEVRALDILGADAVPAKKSFRIKAAKKRAKKHSA